MAEIVATRSIMLAPEVADSIITTPVAIGPQTAWIQARLLRPTTLAPLAWDASGVAQVAIVVTHDGIEYRLTGRVSGGIRRTRTGGEHAEYILTYEMPWGFFDARGGITRRLGETKVATYTAHLEMILLAGVVTTEATVTSVEAPAPSREFRSSVAFQNASTSREDAGDGVFSYNHTSSGTDPAVFVGVAWGGEPPMPDSTSVTYGGASMAEKWDTEDAVSNYRALAGYTLAGQASGSQAVLSTLASGGLDSHIVGTISVTGVDSGTPTGTAVTARGNSTTPSATVSDTDPDGMVVADIISDQNPAPTGTGHTSQWQNAFGTDFFSEGSTRASSDGADMAWTQTSGVWVEGAIEFKPAAEAPAGTKPMFRGS
jgi:hypothetical protein